MALDAAACEYLRALTARLEDALDSALLGAYATGSAALNAYVPGRSDLDVLAVVAEPLESAQRERLEVACAHDSLPCPARKLELVVMTAAQAARPRRGHRVDLNLTTGAELGLLTPGAGWHWFVLDLAVARERGIVLVGPEPAGVLGAVDRSLALAALAETVAWYAREQPGRDAVVAACRAWYYVEHDDWLGKDDAVRWAIARLAPLKDRP